MDWILTTYATFVVGAFVALATFLWLLNERFFPAQPQTKSERRRFLRTRARVVSAHLLLYAALSIPLGLVAANVAYRDAKQTLAKDTNAFSSIVDAALDATKTQWWTPSEFQQKWPTQYPLPLVLTHEEKHRWERDLVEICGRAKQLLSPGRAAHCDRALRVVGKNWCISFIVVQKHAKPEPDGMITAEMRCAFLPEEVDRMTAELRQLSLGSVGEARAIFLPSFVGE